MHATVISGLWGAVAVLTAGAVMAEPVTGKEAKKLIFTPKASEVRVLPDAPVDKAQAALLATAMAGQPWYGAIAISPDEGLMVEATVAAAKYHDVDSAGRAAVAACNEKKKGAADCVVAAVIEPRGWKEGRALQLSQEATEAFRADYKGGALATSATTGAFGIGADAAAALAACAAKVEGVTDCAVVIEG